MTEKENRIIVIKQSREVLRTNTITCPCGANKILIYMYKCLYCGIFFCKKCAKEHFKIKNKEEQEKLEQENYIDLMNNLII